ncbi:hypothetical protein PanWU01x14_215330 [Parasponia andersonii]|uniref:Uncharacterized protein n=1 Tax=Parasponia andersonii TaxID=3476 RepID=A0A2P5BS30_PARAD|nr:hypothetical protein PanWU01x14_215330 [Parasponia andersonii]
MKMLHYQKRVKFVSAINGLNLFWMVAKELRTRGTVNVLISVLREVMVIAFASVKVVCLVKISRRKRKENT